MINFSIIIPCYNSSKYIIRALDSIPKRDDIEIICIDDGSTDNTFELLSSYKALNLKIIRNMHNMTAGFCRNEAFDIATGLWLYGIDSDDWVITDKFNNFLDNLLTTYKEFDMVHIDLEGNTKIFENSKKRTLTGNPTYFVKREFLGNIRGDITIKGYHDDIGNQLMRKLEAKNPKRIWVKCSPIYHYNYPRVGSNEWNYNHSKK